MSYVPGPYIVQESPGGFIGPIEVSEFQIIDSRGEVVTILESHFDEDSGVDTREEVAATACLFATAPELLDAARDLLKAHAEGGISHADLWSLALIELRRMVEQAQGASQV